MIEPRYYIIPYYIYRMQIRANDKEAMAEIALHVVINTITFILFYRPFSDPPFVRFSNFKLIPSVVNLSMIELIKKEWIH